MPEIIRKPQQQRSIDKKNRIIEAGYRLFSEKGYFDTNTAEIAKEASVSTGIVYGYFHDKKDILIEVLDIYIENIFTPIFNMFNQIKNPINFNEIVPHVIEMVVRIHKENAGIHQALYSLTDNDSDVKNKFLLIEEKITENLYVSLTNNGCTLSDLKERIHLAMEMIQSYAHERVFDNHPYINYDKMYDFIVKNITFLFA